MNPLFLDTETTTSNYGNPHDTTNELVSVSYGFKDEVDALQWNEITRVYIQDMVDECDLIVGFHFKFDLHWFMANGIDFKDKPIWDIQLGEFIKSNQLLKLSQNTLDAACERYGVEGKTDK